MWKRLKLHSIKCVLDEPYVAQNPSRINRANSAFKKKSLSLKNRL